MRGTRTDEAAATTTITEIGAKAKALSSPSFALFLFSRKSAAAAPSFPLLPPLSFLARFTLKECITNDDDRAESGRRSREREGGEGLFLRS